MVGSVRRRASARHRGGPIRWLSSGKQHPDLGETILGMAKI